MDLKAFLTEYVALLDKRWRRLLLEALEEDERKRGNDSEACEHEWIAAINEHASGMKMCRKCKEIRSMQNKEGE